jgi:hypothetical protein
VYGFVGGGEQGGGRYGVHVVDDRLHRFPETPLRAMWRLEFEEFQELVYYLKLPQPRTFEVRWKEMQGEDVLRDHRLSRLL